MKIVLLGSGNVATHLGQALKQAGNEILQVWSRKAVNANALASILRATAVERLSDIDRAADLYVISVSDDAIKEVAGLLTLENQLLIHTSGSVGIGALAGASNNIGVIYPVQTFSKVKAVSFDTIPLAVEGNSVEVQERLTKLALTISPRILQLNSEGRRSLHVAAVFACNFSNHLYTLAKKILNDNQLDFDLIRPLIAETAEKVQQFEPDQVQTGPAKRSDLQTLEAHLALLKNQPQLLELYDKLSRSIIDHYKAF